MCCLKLLSVALPFDWLYDREMRRLLSMLLAMIVAVPYLSMSIVLCVWPSELKCLGWLRRLPTMFDLK